MKVKKNSYTKNKNRISLYYDTFYYMCIKCEMVIHNSSMISMSFVDIMQIIRFVSWLNKYTNTKNKA